MTSTRTSLKDHVKRSYISWSTRLLNLFSCDQHSARRPKPGKGFQPALQLLEDRTVFSVFSGPQQFYTHEGPDAVAVGDFNGDDISDLAIANWESDTVLVLQGDGNGSFQEVFYLEGYYGYPGIGYDEPTSLAVSDFNTDGISDLAVVSSGNDQIVVHLGNGDGSFQEEVNPWDDITKFWFSTGDLPRSVVAGDLNGDGNSDLVTANTWSHNVSVLLGNGNGTFQAAVNYAAGSKPVYVAMCDLNGDGKNDLAVANWDSANVSVLLGNGDGTFQGATSYAAGSTPESVAIGDFNGDGKGDLAVANYWSHDISVLLGKGDGTFQAAVNYAAFANPNQVVVGDFNGDGKSDLAVTNYGAGVDNENWDANHVSVLLGNGDGTFQAETEYAAGFAPCSVAVGDFNRDGKSDLAVTNYFPNRGNDLGFHNVSVLLGNGNGTFPSVLYYAAGAQPTSVAMGDFNGDGKRDLAIAGEGVNVLLNNGNGTFQAAVHYAAGGGPYSVAVGDFNGDGKSDLAVTNQASGNVSVLLGRGDGTFQAAVHYGAGEYPRSVAVGDFNGDGKSDLAVANRFSDNVSVLLGRGDGTFQAGVNYGAGSGPSSVAVGDFNGDGKSDLAVANYDDNNVSVLLGNGNGTFQGAVNYGVDSDAPHSVAVGDFNGDGRSDLAVANEHSGNVSVLLGNGDGTFQAALHYPAWYQPYAVAVGDLNGDGHSDLAVANWASENVSVLLNRSPTVTLSTANLAANATQITIAGSGFDPIAANNSVTFNNGAVGTVSSASATSLTVTFATKPAAPGSLTAVVTSDGLSSSSPVQVATVIAVVTPNAASLANTTDGRFVSVTTPPGVTITEAQAIANPSPGPIPANVSAPLGFFSFKLSLQPGAATSVELTIPTGVTINNYYKYGPTPDNTQPHWYSFMFDGTTGAKVQGNVLTLYFVDGQRGDSDLSANGVIADPGGLVSDRNTAFVTALYQDVLGRAPDSAGLNSWLNALQAGVSRSQVGASFWQSPEHRGRQVDAFYATYLHRPADPAFRTVWINNFLNGMSETDVALGFLNSVEYQANHPGTTGWLLAVYQDALGRSPDVSVQALLNDQVGRGVPLAEVARALVTSSQIEGLYSNLLHRWVDSSGGAYWLDFLRGGGTVSLAAQRFLVSDEYFARNAS